MMAVCHRRATWILSRAWRDLLLLGWPQNVPGWWGCLSLCCPQAPWGFYGLGTLSSCCHLSMQKRARERKDTVVPHMDSHAPLCQVSCITLSLNIDLYTFSFFFVFLSFFSTLMPLLSPVSSWQLTPHPPHLKAFAIHSSLCLYSSHIYKLRAHNFSGTSKKGARVARTSFIYRKVLKLSSLPLWTSACHASNFK